MSIFKKLQVKDQKPLYIINAPESFEKEYSDLDGDVEIRSNIGSKDKPQWMLLFAYTAKDVDEFCQAIGEQLEGDPMIWFAYPKKSSRKYKTDINRDQGWESVGKLGLEGVRIVAIDADWSALRFRKVEHIKTMSRRKSMTLSAKGKEKTTGK